MNERAYRTTVGDIVTTDFRTAAVFERFGIDFCCGGRHSFVDACERVGADPDAVMQAIDAMPPVAAGVAEVTAWPLDRLVDYIVSFHHAYVRTALPTIARYLAKLQEVHGARHPELAGVAAQFDALGADLRQHMLKEERVLFPYVRDLVEHEREGCGALMSPFGSVGNPIRVMEREHEEAGEAMRQIRELTNDYTAPADGCTTYEVCMAELARFERDLHRHVHLENHVLFPRTLELETGGFSQ